MKIAHSFYLIIIYFFLSNGYAYSHPHVFVDAKFHIIADKNANLVKLVEDWNFDPMFSASVLMDFSKNKQNLTAAELKKLHDTIYHSMSYFGYFQSVEHQGKKVKICAPHIFNVSFDKILKIHLETKPEQTLSFKNNQNFIFRILDPSFFVNIAYKKDSDITITGLPSYCHAHIVRPDADGVLAKDYQTLSEDFFANPTNAFDLSLQLATRLEVLCTK